MAYEEYDYYNEPAVGSPSLKESLYQILHGLQNKDKLRETGEGIQRLREAIPGVAESVARGAIASVPGSVGDISAFAREYAPEIMDKKFGRRIAPTTREILDYVPRLTPTHEGASTLEDVGAAISPGVGGVAKDVAMLGKGKSLGLSIMGPESALWKPEMEFQAKLMQAKGKSTPEEILQATGMVKGLDGQWRTELSDQFAKLKGEGDTFGTRHGNVHPSNDRFTSNERRAQGVLVEDILHHPDLLEAYPELGKIKVEAHGSTRSEKGSYSQSKNTISLREDLSPDEAKSTLLHELTHDIQAKEGFNRGANYKKQVAKYQSQKDETISVIEELNQEASKYLKAGNKDKYDELMNLRDDLAMQYIKINPEKMGYEDYLHHGGEAEARLVQRRANLSPEELRTSYPYQFTGKTGYGLDINPDEAIITTNHPKTINQPSQSVDYRGAHKAPTNDGYHAPGHELNRGMYPEDVYGPNGHHYYGTGRNKMDREVLKILGEARNNPDHPITVYRAVPGEFKDQAINASDWVTPSLDYAHEHGLRWDNHHIIEKTVPAKHIWTEGNSLHEFGYDPTE